MRRVLMGADGAQAGERMAADLGGQRRRGSAAEEGAPPRAAARRHSEIRPRAGVRSEERRVGKEGRCRWSPYHYKKNRSFAPARRFWKSWFLTSSMNWMRLRFS